MPHNGTGYYVVMTDNTKSGNTGSYYEFQDGHQLLNNTRLNNIYHNEQLSTYPESLNMAEMIAIFNSELTRVHMDFSVSPLDSSPKHRLYLS